MSDRALDWVVDGARHQGLELDGSEHLRIFELTIAQAHYGDVNQWSVIYAANLEKLEGPHRIYVGLSLRIPHRKP